MTGLKELAAEAGVSIRTVARALKGERYVRAEVRDRVMEAAERLGYRPDRRARGLKTGVSHEVAALLSSTDELQIARIAGLESRLREDGFSLSILFDRKTSGEHQTDQLTEELVSRRPAGVVISRPVGPRSAAVAEALKKKGVALVAMDSTERGIDSIAIDRPQGVFEAVKHLAELGRKRIAYLGPKSGGRVAGYRRALNDIGRKAIYLPTPDGLDQYDAGRAAAVDFALKRPRVDGVQAYTDLVALGFMAGLHDAGITVPDEVAVVGFDDRRAAATSWPRLTTVAQPSADIGYVAGEVLLAKITGKPRPTEGWSRTLPTKLVIRETT